jgi:DNA-binding NarL/FixJ family response regulator
VWLRRLLVVEDEPLVASLLHQVLQDAGFSVQTCNRALEARSIVREFDPDGALIDVNLGTGPSGLHLGHLLHRTHPHIGLLFLTKYHDPRVSDGRGLGVPKGSAFLAKDLISDTKVLLDAVEGILRHGSQPPSPQPPRAHALSPLTRTQMEILRLAASGLTNAGIAKARGTNERTVEQRLQSVYRILAIPEDPDINRRVEAVRRYIEVAGIPTLDEFAAVHATP